MKSDPQAGSHFGEGPRKPGLVPQSKRPGLSFVESIDWDRESFVYQSATAWDPAKDYAMMADGPEKESYVSRYLRSRQNGNVKYITALIDGDNLLFRPDRMRMGLEGGKEVAEELRRRIAKKHFLDPEKVDFRLRIFCNMRALAKVLSFTLNVQRNEFWEFQDGMTAMNHQTYFINAGKGHQAADLRVKAALAEAILDPSCYKVYLGGLDDYGYKDELRTIRDMGSLYEKVQLIQVPGYAVDSKMYDEYVHKAIDLDYLFLGKKEEMNARAAAEEEYTDEGRKRNSPCVFHHLTEVGCKLEEACTFSHDPISEAEKEELRKSLKKKKCPSIVRGDKCMFGDDCFFR
ncbi:hypothetical protein IE53DRAFT_313601 [Violaceomyces palustris]|uniref:Uncharacterized protein n=1 Tax=Violaceomyces palustris TaxID=1673888 RepID=A0ACD0P0K7_9BASI|nr:hypothetical protein IE53DRAFT_313601 [Violaceomyces palustris]